MNNPELPMYALDNAINYKYELQQFSSHIYNIYITIIQQYINEFITSAYTNSLYIKDTPFYYYLLEKGVNTINHVFKMMLLQTKNIELTQHYCLKAIYYYTEFIGQNASHTETSIDYNNASLFTYGKTIYNINKTYSKNIYNVLDEMMVATLYNIEVNETVIYKNIEKVLILYKRLLHIFLTTYHNKQSDSEYTMNDKAKLVTYVETNIEKYNIILLDILHVNHILQEKDNEYKLNFVLDIMNCLHVRGTNKIGTNEIGTNERGTNEIGTNEIGTNVSDKSIINAILLYNVLKHVQHNKPKILNKVVLIKKLLSDENHLKLTSDTSENYMNWLLL